MKTFNYVVFFPAAKQVKFGRTRNIKRRIADHRRTCLQAGFGDIEWSAFPAADVVVRQTEISLRQGMRSGVIAGHFEWVSGDWDTYRSLTEATRRIQKQCNELFFGAQYA